MTARSILVIGGGVAGILAALFAAREGATVTLLERNEKLGKKIYITGKGRCNLTNTASREEFMGSIVHNSRFFYAPFACLDNHAMMELMEQLGVPLKVERGNRVFPQSDHASDVTNALQRALEKLEVEIHYNTRVCHLIHDGVRCLGVEAEDGRRFYADAVVLCTGGKSYPLTGSSGDGYTLASEVGHSIQQPLPALVPIETKESWPANLTGLSLRNVALKAWKEGTKKKKFFYDQQGEMLFTHFGISGPLVLTLSSYLPEELEGIHLLIDLKPALDMETLDKRLLRDFKELSRKQISAVMDGLTPHNLGLQILLLAKISPKLPVNNVTQAQRMEIIRLLKGLELTPKRLRGFNEAIVTRGGIHVKEVNPSTMESKRLPGLYFAGEVLDLDAQTGGYNLQIAFSTGALAGISAAQRKEEGI